MSRPLDFKQAAALAGVDPNTIGFHVRSGRLTKGPIIIGGKFRKRKYSVLQDEKWFRYLNRMQVRRKADRRLPELSFVVTEEMFEQIGRDAHAAGTSRSDVVRRILDAHYGTAKAA